ncbi:hypothetical protein HY004_01915 [Candidatus Saccharibacteria bacterium]|nr:hypothetical protein [Candidatus Saccharibacteria bacterium]
MHELTQPESKGALSDNVVMALIAPDPPYTPFGADDSLSISVYRPMKAEGSADKMIAFVDAVEEFIQTGGGTDPANEFNEMKIQRVLALVGDIPEEIPDSERLRAIKHVLDLDWVLNHAGILEVSSFIQNYLRKYPDQDESLKAAITDLIDKKLAVLLDDLRTRELVSGISEGSFSVDTAMEIATAIRETAPDVLPVYDGLVQLLLVAKSYTAKD